MDEPVLPGVSLAASRKQAVTYAPEPQIGTTPMLSPAALEALLSEWFERPVVLLGSGRAGIVVYAKLIGASRHRDVCVVPPFLATCVTDTLSRFAFPVRTASSPKFTLLNHQYGFPQLTQSSGRVLEDICHAFFGSPSTGARSWKCDAAIFSLPKFFGMTGMAGGLVLETEEQRAAAREIVASLPATDPSVATFIRDAITHAKLERTVGTAAHLEAAYAFLNHYVRPDGASLGGVPDTVGGLRQAANERAAIVTRYLERGTRGMPQDFRQHLGVWAPFAFPYFGARDAVEEARACDALKEANVEAAVYHVDVKRNQDGPEYRRCILIPCHQAISADTVDAVVSIFEP